MDFEGVCAKKNWQAIGVHPLFPTPQPIRSFSLSLAHFLRPDLCTVWPVVGGDARFTGETTSEGKWLT